MSKRGHTYHVTLAAHRQDDAIPAAPLVFTHHSHENLAHIAALVRRSTGLDADDAAAAAIGVKLLGSVMLAQKDNPLFDCLRLPLREFIGKLKSLPQDGAA
jgi:hypothetical protein